MKIYAILNENGFCAEYKVNESLEGIMISYSDACSGMYNGRKYDKQTKKWLDEYDDGLRYLVRSLDLPNYAVLQLLESNIVENEKESKKRVAELEEALQAIENANLQFELELDARLTDIEMNLKGGE